MKPILAFLGTLLVQMFAVTYVPIIDTWFNVWEKWAAQYPQPERMASLYDVTVSDVLIFLGHMGALMLPIIAFFTLPLIALGAIEYLEFRRSTLYSKPAGR